MPTPIPYTPTTQPNAGQYAGHVEQVAVAPDTFGGLGGAFGVQGYVFGGLSGAANANYVGRATPVGVFTPASS